jgi:hypothetical protein
MIVPMLTKSITKIKDKLLKNIILKVLVYIIKILGTVVKSKTGIISTKNF